MRCGRRASASSRATGLLASLHRAWCFSRQVGSCAVSWLKQKAKSCFVFVHDRPLVSKASADVSNPVWFLDVLLVISTLSPLGFK